MRPLLLSSRLWLAGAILGVSLLAGGAAPVFAQSPVASDSGGIGVLGVKGLALQPTGEFRFGGLSGFVFHQGGGRFTSQNSLLPAGGPEISGPEWRSKGRLPTEGAGFDLEQIVAAVDRSGFHYQLELRAAQPVATDQVFIALRLPAEAFVGKSIAYNGRPESALPAQPGEPVFAWKARIARIEIPLPGGETLELAGSLTTAISDDRKWGQPHFTLRIFAERSEYPEKGRLASANWSFTARLRPVGAPSAPATASNALRATPDGGFLLPLVASAYELPKWNTWASTDESDGSLRLITRHRDWHQMISYAMKLEGPAERLVFTGRMKTDKVGGGAEYVEAARAQIAFFDESGEQVGGWPAGTVRNGTTPWSNFRQDHKVPAGARYVTVMIGLYVSTGQANYDDLKVRATDAAGAPVGLIRAPNEERTDTSGWWTFEPGPRDTSRPLVLDFSRYLPAPAGKFGFVQARDGHFQFERGGRVRFWGTGATNDFPASREEAERYADSLAAKGMNLARFHGIDSHDKGRNVFVETDGTTQTLDPAKLDRFGYYLAKLKERGIYANINLAAYRRFTAQDGVKDADKLTTGGGAAMFFDRRLIELQKDHATKLMTWVNPHTGLALKDDPVIAMIELKNEISLFILDFMGGIPQSYIDDLDGLFTAWCERARVARPADSVRNLLRDRDLQATRFAEEIVTNYAREMTEHLRAIGVRVPISVSQFHETYGQLRANGSADYVDRHYYWDSPVGGWDPTAAFHNRSQVKDRAKGGAVAAIAPTRWIGKPFTLSEWNFCYPNEWIAEGPMLIAAFSGFQDWDGPMVYASKSAEWAPKHEGSFATDSHPHVMGPMLTAALMYLRGDVAPGPLLARAVGPDEINKSPASLFTVDELVTRRIAVGADRDEPAAGPLGIRWTPGLFVVDTPRSQGYVGDAGSGVTCGDLEFHSRMPFAQVLATSLDDEPLASTQRFVVSLAARSENTGQVYKAFRRGLVKLGEGPILMEPVKARLTIKRAEKPTVHVVDAHGRRTAETVPVTADGPGRWTLDLADVRALWLEVSYP